MPSGAKVRTKKGERTKPPAQSIAPAVEGEVLTLDETARYLRLSSEDVIRLVAESGLPGRRTSGDWRFLKAAIHDWLKVPEPIAANSRFLALAGKFTEDPFLEQIVASAYEQRGKAGARG